jgi:hypothetical protein
MSRPKGPTDPDHRAAWLACRDPAHSWGGEPIDLRARLGAALEAGWSIQALKAYAHSWRYTGHDHVIATQPSGSLFVANVDAATL